MNPKIQNLNLGSEEPVSLRPLMLERRLKQTATSCNPKGLGLRV